MENQSNKANQGRKTCQYSLRVKCLMFAVKGAMFCSVLYTCTVQYSRKGTEPTRPTWDLSEWSRWKGNAVGCLQVAALVLTCCRVTPPLKGSTAGCGRGLPHKDLSHTRPPLHHLRCSLDPLWHSCWSRHERNFPSPRRDFLCAAKGWSRHQGRKELG